MRNGEEDRLGMFEKVLYYLDNNVLTLSQYLPIITDVHARFTQNVQAVFTKAAAAGITSIGFTEMKAQARKSLEQVLLKTCRSMTSFAVAHNRPDIRESANYTKSDLERMRDNDIFTVSRIIYDMATPMLPDLSVFMYSFTDLQTLQTRRDAFFSVIQLPKLKINSRMMYKEEMYMYLAETNNLLRNELDVYMGLIETENQRLFAEYTAARAIDQSGTRSAAIVVENNVSARGLAVVATQVYDKDTTFIFKNTGTTSLVFGLSADGVNFKGTTVTLPAGAEVEREAADLSDDGDIILVQNEGSAEGRYKVKIA